MLSKKIIITGNTVVDEVEIASYSAVLNTNDMDLSLISRYVDKEACKIHKDIVRADQAEFEDYAYSLQDMLKG